MNKTAKEIVKWRKSKGFYTPSSLAQRESREAMLGKLMLVVTEVAEAAEAVRHSDPVNFKEEIADTIIRLLDIAGSMDIDIEKEIDLKMQKNALRPVRHGKTTLL